MLATPVSMGPSLRWDDDSEANFRSTTLAHLAVNPNQCSGGGVVQLNRTIF